MKLYDYVLSASCYKVRLMAALVGVKLELEAVDFHPGRMHKSAAFRQMNPAGTLPVLVDGAHAPGPVELDIPGLGVDWYAANLHKWCFAPRSCGVLWAAPGRQAVLHPGVISWGITEDDWLQEFEWTGTRDPSPWLAAPAGLDFMRDVLGVAAMRTALPSSSALQSSTT